MVEPVTLVPKQTVALAIRSQVVAALRASLERAERGEVSAVAIYELPASGQRWSLQKTIPGDESDALGKLEILKALLLADLLARME